MDNDFEAYEEFIGMHVVDSIDASTLYQVIKDVILKLNLCITKARRQCYDGAAAMSGCRSEVAKRIWMMNRKLYIPTAMGILCIWL